jgi:thiol-disulfide isomerase/thioredoxin
MLELFYLRTDLPQDSLRSLFVKFPASLKKNKQAYAIADYLANKKPAIGMQAAEVAAKDGNGKTYRLSALRGKYVLLEFWASWCGPCRYENPELVKAYEKYHPKGLEILGISVDANKESWQQAVEKDKLSWINISELNGYYGKAVVAYHVRGIPQNYLIDPAGNIIAIDLRGEKLVAKLKSLLDQ